MATPSERLLQIILIELLEKRVLTTSLIYEMSKETRAY